MNDRDGHATDSVKEKGPNYQSLTRVSDTSEGGLEKIIFDDMLARGWQAGNTVSIRGAIATMARY
jgi:hypothetical protein